jgi:hypothetical protein
MEPFLLDGRPDLTCKDSTTHYVVDGWDRSRPASPTEQVKPAVGGLATCWRTWSLR